MTSDQHEKEMKTLKENHFMKKIMAKIRSCVSSRMKRKLFVDINTEGPLIVKPKIIIFTNSTNEEGEQFLDKNMSC